MLSKKLATWSEAEQFCCSIGMNLLTVFSVQKQRCLYDVLSTRLFNNLQNTQNVKRIFSAPFEQNVEYWTSANDLDCPGRFRWCATNFKDFAKDDLNWLQPKSTGSCVYVRLKKGSTGDPQLGTGSCAKRRRFVCEANYNLLVCIFHYKLMFWTHRRGRRLSINCRR